MASTMWSVEQKMHWSKWKWINKQTNKQNLKHKYTTATTESINIYSLRWVKWCVAVGMACMYVSVWQRVKLFAKVDIIYWLSLTLSWIYVRLNGVQMNEYTDTHSHILFCVFRDSHPMGIPLQFQPFKLHRKFHTNKANSHALVEVYLVRVVNEKSTTHNKVMCHDEYKKDRVWEMICK